jgi:hypothetical protein
MSTWRVGLTQTVIEGCTVTVEADTAKEAEQQAIEIALSGDVQWSDCDVLGEIDAVIIEQVTEKKESIT